MDLTEPRMNLGVKLLEVQKNISAVKKTANNPHFKSKYADLNEVLDVVKGELSKHDLYLLQPVGKDDKGVFVETRIQDVNGVGVNSVVYLTGYEDNMQKMGGAITYARRYGVTALLALETEEDDDGETAVGRGGQRAPSTSAPKAPAQSAAAPTPKAPQKRELLQKQIDATGDVLIQQGTGIDTIKAHITKKWGMASSTQLDAAQAAELLTDLKAMLK